MNINLWQTILAGVVASIAWFVIGGGLYMNPLIAKIYKNAESSPGLKKWSNTPKYIGFQFLGMLIQALLWAFVFAYLKSVLPEAKLSAGLVFGLILVAIKIIPRAYDMWIQTTYPNKLLLIEFINGTIGSFVMALIFAYIIL